MTITKNGVHPSTKLHAPQDAGKTKPKQTPLSADPSPLADKLYGKKLGLRGVPVNKDVD